MVPLPHQLYALNRAVSRDRIRYLLADEVGLGKTIEAGLVLRELKLRGRVKRILVVAPKGLVRQWQAELRDRGFEVMPYDDPFAFRAEYEERYRAAWDRGEQGPAPSLVLHLHNADAGQLPWDIVHQARVVRLAGTH